MTSKESMSQGESGKRGAEASQTEGGGQQPSQGSGRVNQPRSEEEQKHTFEPGRAPSEQGEKEHRSAQVIAKQQQGVAGSGSVSGNTRAHSDGSEEQSQSGAPTGEHTRHGRQGTPGNRPK